MDILKELFGTSDELQINKSLFGSEVGHVESLNMGLDHGLSSSREHIQRPLPLLPDPRPANPPSLLRSQSLDDLPVTTEDKDPLEMYRSDEFRSQSAFPQLSASAATTHVDLHNVPQEMPMYLLQEDEGNDDEIMRLLGTSNDATPTPSNGGDFPSTINTEVDVMPSPMYGDSQNEKEQDMGDSILSEGGRDTSDVLIAEAASVISDETLDKTADQIEQVQELESNSPTASVEVISPVCNLDSNRVSEPDSNSGFPMPCSSIPLPSFQDASALSDARTLSLNRLSEADTPPTSLNGATVCHTQLDFSTTSSNDESCSQTSCVSTFSEIGANGSVSTVAGLRRKTPSVSWERRALMVNEGTQTLTWKLAGAASATGGVNQLPLLPLQTMSAHDQAQSPNDQASTLQSPASLPTPQSPVLQQDIHKTKPLLSTPVTEVALQLNTTVTSSPAASRTFSDQTCASVPVVHPLEPSDNISVSSSPQHITRTVPVTKYPILSSPPVPLVTPPSTASSSHLKSNPPLISSLAPSSVSLSLSPASSAFTTSANTSVGLSAAAPPMASATLPKATHTTSTPTPALTRPAQSIASNAHTAASVFEHSLEDLKQKVLLEAQKLDEALGSYQTHQASVQVSGVPSPTHPQPVAMTNTPPVLPPTPSPQITTHIPSLTIAANAATHTLCTPLYTTTAAHTLCTPLYTTTAVHRIPHTTTPNSAAHRIPHTTTPNSAVHRIPHTTTPNSAVHRIPHTTTPNSAVHRIPHTTTPNSAVQTPHYTTTTSTATCVLCTSSFDTSTSSTPDALSTLQCTNATASSHQKSDMANSRNSEPTAADVLSPMSPTNSTLVTCAVSSQSLLPPSELSPLVITSVVSCANDDGGEVVCVTPSHEDNVVPVPEHETMKQTPDQTTDVEMEPVAIHVIDTESVCSLEKEGTMEIDLNHVDKDTSDNLKERVNDGETEQDDPPCSVASQQMDIQESASKEDNEISQLSTTTSPVSNLHKAKAQEALELPTAQKSITVCFPVVDWKMKQICGGHMMGLSATPIQLLPTTNGLHPPDQGGGGLHSGGEVEERERKKLKRRHTGGWTKGKKRKIETEPRPPKPPSTGYGIFLTEKRASVQQESGCNSMSHISKMLGSMWTTLTREEKKGYYSKAEADKQRYTQELRAYLSTTTKVDNSSTNLQLLDAFLSQSSENESNDDILVCHLCQITFTSLHNKRSHYSGKIHSKVLVERLSKLLSCQKPTRGGEGGIEDGNSQKTPGISCGEKMNLPQLQDVLGDRAVVEAAELCQGRRTEVMAGSSLDYDGHTLCNNEQSRTGAVGDCEHGTELHTSGVTSEVNSKDNPQHCVPDSAHHTTNHSAMEATHIRNTSQWNSSTTSSESSSTLGSDPVAMVTTTPVLELHSGSCSPPAAGSQVSGDSNEQDSCEVVSSYLHSCATAYQSCAAALRAQRQHYTAALEEHANLQQQHAELEQLMSDHDEALACLQLEEQALQQQVSRLLTALRSSPSV